jgi:predicted DNA-binding transcriptional regulator AlpA
MDFSAYPPFLKARDIVDMLQCSRSKAYDFMHESGLINPKLGKIARVPRDSFILWVSGQNKSA